jgi:protein tyrosine phosphatase (PTP) superfamily phosphohydrolase (DUF442 family)
MTIDNVFNYKKISDTIITTGLASEEQLAELAVQGFAVVIDLLPHDSEYAIANEQEIIEQQGMVYHSIPVDFGEPGEEDFNAFSSLLDSIGKQKALIHCAANYRVSAFYALYGYKQLGWSEQQADDLIQSIWNPQQHSPWPEFIKKIKLS